MESIAFMRCDSRIQTSIYFDAVEIYLHTCIYGCKLGEVVPHLLMSNDEFLSSTCLTNIWCSDGLAQACLSLM